MGLATVTGAERRQLQRLLGELVVRRDDCSHAIPTRYETPDGELSGDSTGSSRTTVPLSLSSRTASMSTPGCGRRVIGLATYTVPTMWCLPSDRATSTVEKPNEPTDVSASTAEPRRMTRRHVRSLAIEASGRRWVIVNDLT